MNVFASRWLILALALTMGAVQNVSFAPYGWSWLALPPLMFLYAVWTRAARPRLASYVFGLGVFGCGVWWVYISIHDYGGGDAAGSIALTVFFVMFWALFPWLAAAAAAWIARRTGGLARVCAAAAAWEAVEYFRGDFLLNGFPWLQIGYSQIDTPLAGYAPVLGVYGIGFLLAASAFLLVELGWRRLPWPYVWLLALVWGGGAGLRQISWSQAAGPPFEAVLLQGNISQDLKWRSEEKLKTLKLYRDLTDRHWDARLIIWPETAIPAFFSQVKDFYLKPLAADAERHGVDLVVSLPFEGEDKDYYNSVLTLGAEIALYHKHHLLPFGEYLPLQPLSGWVLGWLNIPLGEFSAGDKRQPLLQAAGYPFVTTICYEDAFGAEVAVQSAEAAFLVNVTNDAWFGESAQPFQHLQMAQMRALETGRYLLRATNTAVTAVVGPDGRVREQAPPFQTAALTAWVTPMSGVTPYARFGDAPAFAGMAVLCGILLWRRRITSKI